ncbi:MAG: mucin9, partial [Solirubrobacteraceae bacterium]|nr:mucin9 [Solirubrobacteraceae bacterium]
MPRSFGRAGLGTRRQRYWFAVLGTIALSLPYATLIVGAIRAQIDAPAAVVSIPAFSIPVPRFPQVALPARPATGTATPAAAAANSRTGSVVGSRTVSRGTTSRRVVSGRRVVTHRRIPVVSSTYSRTPGSSPGHAPVLSGSAAAGALAIAIASAPIVVNTAPVTPPLPAASPIVGTPPAPATGSNPQTAAGTPSQAATGAAGHAVPGASSHGVAGANSQGAANSHGVAGAKSQGAANSHGVAGANSQGALHRSSAAVVAAPKHATPTPTPTPASPSTSAQASVSSPASQPAPTAPAPTTAATTADSTPAPATPADVAPAVAATTDGAATAAAPADPAAPAAATDPAAPAGATDPAAPATTTTATTTPTDASSTTSAPPADPAAPAATDAPSAQPSGGIVQSAPAASSSPAAAVTSSPASQSVSAGGSTAAIASPTAEVVVSSSVPTNTTSSTTTLGSGDTTVAAPSVTTTVTTSLAPVTESTSGSQVVTTGLSTAAPVTASALPVSSNSGATIVAGSTGSTDSTNLATATSTAGAAGTSNDGSAGPATTSSSSLVPSASDGATILTSSTLAPASSVATPGSGRGPPTGSVLIHAAEGGTVTSGDATLTFAPGSLPSDAYVSITPTTVTLPGLNVSAPAYDLHAIDVATGATIENFGSPPVLTIAGSAPGSTIYYLDPVSGPQPISSHYDAAAGTVTAGLPHFSTYFSGTSFTVDQTGSAFTVTGLISGHTLTVSGSAANVTVADLATSDASTFTVPSAGSLTINAPGDTVEFVAGTLNLGSATLTVAAQNVTVDAGASVTAASVSLVSSVSDSSASTTGATLAAGAQTLIDGTIISTGAVILSASVTHTINLASQTLSADLTYALGSTAIAEVQAGATISAGSLQVTATTTVAFTYAGSDSGVTATVNPTDPDGINGAVRVNPTDVTHAGIAGGASVTVTGTADAVITAIDTTNIATTIVDTTDYTKLNATSTDLFLQFGRILIKVTMSRDTKAYVSGTPASGKTLNAGGAAKLHAENTGQVAGTITSTVVGKVDNEITQDDALAFVQGAAVSAAGLALSSLTNTEYDATAKVAGNALTGNTKATVTGSTVTVGAAGESQDAHDQTVLSAISGDALFQSLSPLVVLTSTMATNALSRNTEATITSSTVTITGGDLTLTATADGHVLAWAQSTSAKTKDSNIPTSSAKGLAATFAANVINGGARAFIVGSTASAVNVTLAAKSGAFIDSTSEIAVHTLSPPDTVSAGTGLFAPGDMAVGASLSLNYVGWLIADLGQLALGGIDAVLGTNFGGTEQPLETVAYVRDSTLTATGAASITADGAEQINSTVSNTAETTNAGIYGAKTTAADVIVSSNRVSSTAKAFIDRTGATVPTVDPTVIVTGALSIAATDGTGIFSNAKLVASGITTNDGGVHFLNQALYGTPSHDLTTSQGTQTLTFGTRVLIDQNFGTPSFAAGGRQAAVTPVTTGYVVKLGDSYGIPTLTSNDGFRILSRGDVVQVADDWTGGGNPAATYEYVGPSQRTDLGNTDYSDASLWAPVGGTPGATYTYVPGSAASLDLNAIDYSDATQWQPTSGGAGTVYEWMGPTTSVNLGTANYTDLGFWKPIPATQLLPTGFNLTVSNSTVVGGIAVVNYVDNDTEAYLQTVNVRAGSITISAGDSGMIEATNDATFVSAGGSSINGTGTSLAAGAVIATNVVLSKADAFVNDSDVATTTGGFSATATNSSQIDATTHSAAQSGAKAVGIDMAFNTIGWKMQNALFNALDALIGDPLISAAFNGSQPAETQAYVQNSSVSAATDVNLSANSTERINAHVDNSATAAPAAMFGAAGTSAGAVLSSSMVNAEVRSFVDYGTLPYDFLSSAGSQTIAVGQRVRLPGGNIFEYLPPVRGPPTPIDLSNLAQYSGSSWRQLGRVDAAGAFTATAIDDAGIATQTSMYGAVSPTNDAGTGILNLYAGDLLDNYTYTSHSQPATVQFGDTVRVADDYLDPAGAIDATFSPGGKVFEYMGTGGALDLGSQDYSNYGTWKQLDPTNIASILSSAVYAALGEIGTRLDKDGLIGGSNSYFGLIDHNDVRSSVQAFVNAATLNAGGDVTLSAFESARIAAQDASDVQPWTGLGAVIVTNVILDAADAYMTNGALSAANVTLDAENVAQIDATATSTIEAWDATSVVLAFNSIGWKPSNILFNAVDALIGDPAISGAFNGEQAAEAQAYLQDVTVNASGDLSLTANSKEQLDAAVGNENTVDAAVDFLFSTKRADQKATYDAKKNPKGSKVAGYGASGSAGGGLIASNKVDSFARAYITFTGVAQGVVNVTGAVTISAADQTGIDAHSSVVQDVTTTNTLAGLATLIGATLVKSDYKDTTASGTQTLATKDRVRVGPSYAGGGDTGSVYEYIGPGASLNLGAQNYTTDTTNWKKIVGGASDLSSLYPNIGNLTNSDARAVGVLIVLNDVRSDVNAYVHNANLHADALAITALENAELAADAEINVSASGGKFNGKGDVLGASGQLVTNVVLSGASAYVDSAQVTTSGEVTLDAENTSGIDATILSATSSSGGAFSIVLAFNSIGWKSENVLFSTIDALIGDPVLATAFNGAQPSISQAYISGSTIEAGAVSLTANDATQLNATVSNAASSVASALYGASGKSAGALVATNKVDSQALAYVSGGLVTADELGITAADAAGVFADVKMVSSSITTNDGGARVLQDEINNFQPADFLSSEGPRAIKFGQTVRLAPGYANGGTAGGIYEWMGPDAPAGVTVDLSNPDHPYTDLGWWKPVPATQLIPQGNNFAPGTSDSTAVGGLVVMNDVRSTVLAEINGATVTVAGGVDLSAGEKATIDATADSSATSSGGSSFNGKGDSNAIDGVISTNVVLSSANADIKGSTVTTTAAGKIALDAANESAISADTESATTSAGKSVGVLIAFNTIGWQASNLLFNALDALIGLDATSFDYQSTDAPATLNPDDRVKAPDGNVYRYLGPTITSPNLSNTAQQYATSASWQLVTSAFGTEQVAQARAYIQDATITAAGDLTLSADTKAELKATVGNDATSYAAALYGASDMTAAAVLASNKVATDTEAFINNTNPNAGVRTAGAGGNVALSATDAPSIEADSHVGTSTKSVNDLGVGLLSSLVNSILHAYQYTSNSGTQTLNFGDRVRVADDFAGSGTQGGVYQYMGTTAPLDLGTVDYTDLNFWKPLNDTNIVPQSVINAALKAFKLDAGTAKTFYGLVDRNDVQGDAQSYLSGIALTATGDVSLTANESAAIAAKDGSEVETGATESSSIGGVMVTNQVQSEADAFGSGGSIHGAAVDLEATNSATIDATAESKAEAHKSIGAIIAFNTVGWQADNVLFQAIDALLGSSYLTHENPAAARAYLLDTPVTATGDLTLNAENEAKVTAEAANEQASNAINTFAIGAKFGVEGSAAGGILAANKASATAQAYIENASLSDVTAGGALSVTAKNSAEVESSTKLEVSSVTQNNLDAVKTILQALIPSDYQYTTKSGTQTLQSGDRVRSLAGAIYKYVGTPGPVDLGTTDFTNAGLWTLLAGGASADPTSLFPNFGNLTDSDAQAVGIVFVLNDARGSAQAYIDNATVKAASVAIAAREDTTIAAEAEDNVHADGGSAFGKGTVLSAGGQAVTNLVLSSAEAALTNSSVHGPDGTTPTGAVSVAGEDTSRIDATLLSSFSSAGNAIGLMLAFNSIGWKPSNLLFNAVDALVGDPLISTAFNGAQPASTLAHVDHATIDGADIEISADNLAQINSTVSNAATSTASALYGAKGESVGAVIASNKVNSTAQADAVSSELTADGGVAIDAQDSAGIFTNAKLVSSSITTNDGGASVIQSEIDNFVPADFATDSGVQNISFGQTVRIADGYATPKYTSDQVVSALAPSDIVALASDFGTSRLTSSSGKRLLLKGDNVTVDTGYTGGGVVGQVYQWTGASGLYDLGAQDYTAANWTPIGGTPDSVYQYTGTAASNVDLDAQDYTDTSLWTAKGGTPGSVYEYMGPTTPAPLDLGTQDYTDLRFWKPASGTQIVPQGLNVTGSDSTAAGGIVVLNDVRSDVEAYVLDTTVSAASVSISAKDEAFIRALVDSSISSSGGSSFDADKGASLAVNAVIATNVVLSKANARIDASSVDTNGNITVEAEDVSQIDATNDNSASSAGNAVALTLAFNSIGWNEANLLFNLIDPLIGAPVLANENPSSVVATITASHAKSTGGAIDVAAINEAAIHSDLSNKATAESVGFSGGATFSLGLAISSNMVSIKTQALIDYGTQNDYTPASTPDVLAPGDRVDVSPTLTYEYVGNAVRGPPAGFLSDTTQHYATNASWLLLQNLAHDVSAGAGGLSVTASDTAEVEANIEVETSAKTKSNLAGTMLLDYIKGVQTDYQYTSHSGLQKVQNGELVRTDSGDVYAYTGPSVTTGPGLDLSETAQNYAANANWGKVSTSVLDTLTQYFPNLSQSNATGVGGLAALNDVRGGATASIADQTTVHSGGELTVQATESATIRAEDKSKVEVEGSSPFKEGTSAAFNFVIVTNAVLAGATATITNAGATADGAILVSATDAAGIEAAVESEATSGGDAIGATLAFNSVGYNAQNILFNLADAIAGTSIGSEKPVATSAIVSGSTLEGESVQVTAASTAEINANVVTASRAFEVIPGKSAGTKIAVDVVVSMNKIATHVEASDSSAASLTADAGSVSVTSSNTSDVLSKVTAAALSIADGFNEKGTSVTVGISISRNEIDDQQSAFISGVADVTATTGSITISADEGATIEATSTASAIAVAVSASGSAMGFSGGGATALNKILGTANAYALDSALTATGTAAGQGSVSITTQDTSEIHATVQALAIAAAVGDGTSVAIAIGFSLARNLIGWTEYHGADPSQVNAYAKHTSITAPTGITVTAADSSTIDAVVEAMAVAVSAGTGSGLGAAAGGLWTDNKIATQVEAYIDGSRSDGTLDTTPISVSTTGGDITVSASATGDITADARAGAVAANLSGETAVAIAIGLSLAHNTVADTVAAYVANVVVATTDPSLTAGPTGNVTITATDSGTIAVSSIAVAVSVA